MDSIAFDVKVNFGECFNDSGLFGCRLDFFNDGFIQVGYGLLTLVVGVIVFVFFSNLVCG